MEVQTRDRDGALRYFPTVKEAFDYAMDNNMVWKVSFNAEDGSRARFVRNVFNGWVYAPIMEGVNREAETSEA